MTKVELGGEVYQNLFFLDYLKTVKQNVKFSDTFQNCIATLVVGETPKFSFIGSIKNLIFV